MTSDQDRHAQFMVEAMKVVAATFPGTPKVAQQLWVPLATQLAALMLEEHLKHFAEPEAKS